MNIRIYRPGHKSMWNVRHKMEKYRLTYDISEKQYIGQFDMGDPSDVKRLGSIRRYAFWHVLRLEYGKFGERSRDYRKTFFSHNKPVFGRYYFCAYCGMPVTAKELEVDHLYPVAKVRGSAALQKKLKLMGAVSVNSLCNLVPACHRCNKKKSAHMGAWILLGRIGRHQKLWFFRWVVRFTVLAAVIVLVMKLR